MPIAKPITAADISTPHPVILKISPADLKDALVEGLADFSAKPSHIIMLVVIFPLIGLISARLAAGYDVLHLVFPMVTGFALMGPLAAIGLYELSRRRELGLDISWRHTYNIIHSPSIGAILKLSLLLGAIYIAWLGAAQTIYWINFGSAVPASIADFALQILTTSAGWTLIILGCGVGFVFALVVLAVSAISFPMLLDREVGAMVAVQTSINAFLANPKTISIWGMIVAGSLVVGSLPAFIGLAVVLPVLGHATWHLYRKVVAYEGS